MRRVVSILLLILTLCGCGRQKATQESNATQTAARGDVEEDQQSKKTPRIWLDEESARMIEVMSGDSDTMDKVYVIRWEGDELHGQAKLESGDGSESFFYDLGLSSDLTDSSIFEDASGWLVVAMRKQANMDDERFDVRIEEQFTVRTGNESQTREFNSRRGTLVRFPLDADREDGRIPAIAKYGTNYFKLMKWEDGESVPWLELRLGDTLSAVQADAEPRGDRKPK